MSPSGTGGVAFVYEDPSDSSSRIELVGWKGKATVRAHVANNERLHYLTLLGADTAKYERNKFKEQRDQEGKEDEAE